MSPEDWSQIREVQISPEDLINSGWREVVAASDKQDYFSLHKALHDASVIAWQSEQRNRARSLWLFAQICSMRLVPTSPNEPFQPFAVFPEWRSTVVDDLADEDFDVLAESYPEISHAKIMARAADVCWLRKRHADHLRAAVDAYSLIVIDDDCRGECLACLKRSIVLAMTLKDQERLDRIEAGVFDRLERTSNDQYPFACDLAEVMVEHRMCRSHAVPIAERLTALGDLHKAAAPIAARRCFLLAARWYRRAEESERQATVIVQAAQTYEIEADSRLAVEGAAAFWGAHFYEQAIQMYRQVPRAQRAQLLIDEKIADLRSKLTQAGQRSMNFMSAVTTGPIDITKWVNQSRTAVQGKALPEALDAFCNLCSTANVESLRVTALEAIKRFPFQHLFGTSTVSADGRTVGKRPALSASMNPSEINDGVLLTKMVEDHCLSIQINVQGALHPAHEQMLAEHRITEPEFLSLTRNCPILPTDQTALWAKALWSGYDLDFSTSTLLLPPLIENLVRSHVKSVGGTTTTLDREGIEQEIGLSSLIEVPQAAEVLGDELAFEIRALFCSAFGPNLRNSVAHGLVTDQSVRSVYALYAWWLSLRIVWLSSRAARALT